MLPSQAHKNIWLLKDVGSFAQPRLLGCQGCLDVTVCGGLHLPNGSAMLTCLDHCSCTAERNCDFVCPHRPSAYAKRVREVQGFRLDNIPCKATPQQPSLPNLAAIIEGRITRGRPVELEFASIPLTRALTGRGQKTRAKTAEEIIRTHGVTPKKGWIVTGTEDDRYVERTWGLARPREIFKSMKAAGVAFATSPNYSLYADSPRHDNLHAMKRIAWMWYMMNDAGLPTALHINGRTDRDFERWAEFIAARPEVTSIACEFLTGAKLAGDADRLIARLTTLREHVGRPLLIVVRGAGEHAQRLRAVFEQVLWLSAGAYLKAVHRQAPTLGNDQILRFKSRNEPRNAPIGTLFKQIVSATERRYHSATISMTPSPQGSFDFQPVESPSQMSTNDTPDQLNLFA